METDHVDGDKLNNQRSNLRICNGSQNQMNRGIQKSSTTGFKGVSPLRNQFRAQIYVNGRQYYLGSFETKALASAAYKEAVLKYHGEFARALPPKSQ